MDATRDSGNTWPSAGPDRQLRKLLAPQLIVIACTSRTRTSMAFVGCGQGLWRPVPLSEAVDSCASTSAGRRPLPRPARTGVDRGHRARHLPVGTPSFTSTTPSMLRSIRAATFFACGAEHRWGRRRIELDLDRLRDGGEIADQILDELRDLDLDAWHAFTPKPRQQRLAATSSVGLGCGPVSAGQNSRRGSSGRDHRRGRYQAAARRSAPPDWRASMTVDLRRPRRPLSFERRTRPRSVIVHDEAAFVDLRHEACRHIGIADITDRQERNGG